MAKRKMKHRDGRRKSRRVRTNSHEGTLSRDEFAGRMMDAIRWAGETRPIRYDAEGFMLVSEGGVLNLANIFRVYCCARDRAKVFRDCVATWFAHRKIPENYEDTTPELLPLIIRQTQYDASVLNLIGDGGEDHDFRTWPIADHLTVVAAYDLPECIATLAPWNLTALWGVDYDKALRDACANLLEISKEPFESPQPGVYVSPWRDNHDASRLLLIDRIKQLDVKGDHVAMVPNRDTLLVTGSRDSAGLERMAEIADAAMDEPYPISALPVRLAGDAWEMFMPDTDHPSFRDFRSLRTRSIAVDYGEQQETLNLLFEFEDAGIFVSSYSVLENRTTRECISYCAWTDGLTQVLPHTDTVGFVCPSQPEGQRVVAADWDSVFSIMAEAMTPVGSYPERYLVSEFPTPDELSAMGARNPADHFGRLGDRGDQGT